MGPQIELSIRDFQMPDTNHAALTPTYTVPSEKIGAGQTCFLRVAEKESHTENYISHYYFEFQFVGCGDPPTEILHLERFVDTDEYCTDKPGRPK